MTPTESSALPSIIINKVALLNTIRKKELSKICELTSIKIPFSFRVKTPVFQKETLKRFATLLIEIAIKRSDIYPLEKVSISSL